MNQNDAYRYTSLGLPEDIRAYKEIGDFDNAVRLIDLKLADAGTPECMRQNLIAQREICLRFPQNYPYTKEEGLVIIQKEIPDFTMAELEAYMDNGRIAWHYVNGVQKLLSSFFGTLRKTVPAFAARLPKAPVDPAKVSHELLDRTSRLNRCAKLMREKGHMSARIRIRTELRIKDEAFVPGETYRIWLPIAAACIQQSEIKIEAFSSQPTFVAPEDAAQRTVYWEETMTENHPFWVEFSYKHTAPFSDPSAVKADPVQPDFDTCEIAPNIVFTPFVRALCEELSAGTDDPIEKARRFYNYVTEKVCYSFMPDYFIMTDIAENCLKTRRGDCGVQALAFVTLCRCAGIPAKWQSGMEADPESVGSHDWAMFYVAPKGWMFADPSFGGSAFRDGCEERHNHYFGNLDMFRCVTVNGYQQDFEPASKYWRHDPYDNQVGEVEDSKRAYRRGEVWHDQTLVSFEELAD